MLLSLRSVRQDSLSVLVASAERGEAVLTRQDLPFLPSFFLPFFLHQIVIDLLYEQGAGLGVRDIKQ